MNRILQINGKNSFVMCCDFCAGSELDAGVFLIASPNGTHICQNCVAICATIIDDRGIERFDLDAPEAKESSE